MSKRPLTEEQKDHIREGVLKYYRSPAGKQRIRDLKSATPWNKGVPGQVPWNKGMKGAVNLSKDSRRRISAHSRQRRPICQYSKNGELILRWPSIKDASLVSGICYMSLVYAVTGRRKTAGGYYWKYDTES